MIDLDRSDLRDMGLGGTIAASGLDLVLYGGDLIFALVALLVSQADVLLTILANLLRVADSIPFVSEELLQVALTIVGLVFAVVSIVRLGRRAQKRLSNQN